MLEMTDGVSIVAVGRGEIQRPSALPDAEKSIDASYYLPCNLKPVEPMPMAVRLFRQLLGGKAL